MEEYSRIVIEEYCMTHPGKRKKAHFYGILLNCRIRWSASRKIGKEFSWNVIYIPGKGSCVKRKL